MKTPITATAVGFLFLLFVFTFAFTNQFQGHVSVTLGSAEIPLNRQLDIRSLVNRTESASNGNYDSLDFPRGTTFTVPPGKTLVITSGCAVNVGAAIGSQTEIGYGDDAVADSAAPPTNFVVLFSGVCTATDLRPMYLRIPEGKVPYMRSHDSGGAYDWEGTAVGLLRPPTE